ncbi:hypothetical protein C7402_101528 [Paraburkholderia unamae]|uniref:Uncharacterized protein n=1 Tax=Paraburkholderia unamae TaxID=219649 RepID=A0ABX5KVX0_9BURK|nr:hypothetical protein C7402_101528 [Paraburkholderia unamae]RAR61943.1 hypothetical protein C7401_107268 [Paraburkholderia unamae]
MRITIEGEAAASRAASMTRDPQQRRTPAEIRAGNRRIGLILLAVVAAFFLAGVIKQVYFAGH